MNFSTRGITLPSIGLVYSAIIHGLPNATSTNQIFGYPANSPANAFVHNVYTLNQAGALQAGGKFVPSVQNLYNAIINGADFPTYSNAYNSVLSNFPVSTELIEYSLFNIASLQPAFPIGFNGGEVP